ncbi:MAG: phosphatase PAP2 family protein [Treponema sp.]|jgi:membrane-associated phospholipid phosphatase|nr:phosphatase PAP2 family protein [Treponema sp.]
MPCIETNIPFSRAFRGLGKNFIGCLTLNHGIFFLLSGCITYGFIRGGLDWLWYQMAYGNRTLARLGMASNLVGYCVPALFPALSYAAGIAAKKKKWQTLGIAITQAALIACVVKPVLSALTGRKQAGIYDLDPSPSDYSGDFSFGFLNRGFIDGWPSGHTMHAMAAMVILSELSEKKRVAIPAYLYAAAMIAGMAFCDHWVSDNIAGAMMGYAIGKTVAKSFKPPVIADRCLPR